MRAHLPYRPLRRERRRSRTEQVLLREVNDAVQRVAVHFGDVAHLYRYACECSFAECQVAVQMSVPEYEAVRASSGARLVALGHDDPAGESVVLETARYAVVTADHERSASLPRGSVYVPCVVCRAAVDLTDVVPSPGAVALCRDHRDEHDAP